MNELKDKKPIIKAWYSVRFKSRLSPYERDKKGLARTFIDFVFFNGSDWDASEYKELGFYVSDIIKLAKEQAK